MVWEMFRLYTSFMYFCRQKNVSVGMVGTNPSTAVYEHATFISVYDIFKIGLFQFFVKTRAGTPC